MKHFLNQFKIQKALKAQKDEKNSDGHNCSELERKELNIVNIEIPLGIMCLISLAINGSFTSINAQQFFQC